MLWERFMGRLRSIYTRIERGQRMRIMGETNLTGVRHRGQGGMV